MRVVGGGGGGAGRGVVLGRGRRRGLTARVISWLTDGGFTVLVVQADRSMVIVRDCLAGDCDPTFLIFARNRGGARKGTTTHDPTFLVGVRRSRGIARVGETDQTNVTPKSVYILFFLVIKNCIYKRN